MPTYPYACTACGHKFEVVQSFSDAPLTTCPECDGPLRKIFSSVGIVFKGPGFYRTDSRASNGRGTSALNGSGNGRSKDKDSTGTSGDATKPAGEKAAAGTKSTTGTTSGTTSG